MEEKLRNDIGEHADVDVKLPTRRLDMKILLAKQFPEKIYF